MLAIPIMIVATEQLDTGLLSKVIVGNDGTEYAFGSSLFTASWKDIASGLAWGLGYFGMPHIIVRFMSIEKASMVKKSATVAIIWVVLSLGSVCLIAYFGRMLVAEELLANGMQKTIFITLARRLFPAFHRGRAARGDHGGVHVHGRQPAAGRVQLVHVGHLQAGAPQERLGQGDPLGRACGRAAGRGGGLHHRDEQGRRPRRPS